MFTTPNMSLTAWNDLGDGFNHTELAANWSAVDAHDHTTGKGVAIPTGGIAPLAITTAKIATGAVTSDKLASGLDASKLADGSVTTAKLASGAVTYDRLATLPQCRAQSTSAFAVPNNTATLIQFTGTRFCNPGSMWSAGAPTNVVAPYSGLYAVNLVVAWDTASGGAGTGVRRIRLLYNNTIEIAGDGRSASASIALQTTSTFYRFTAGDYVVASAFQTSGGALNLTYAGTTAAPELTMVYLGP